MNETTKKLVEALEDILSGWKYIRQVHGDLYGVGWDRAQIKSEQALSDYRAEQDKPKNELVELDENKVLNLLSNGQNYEQIPYDTRVKISKVICKTFGTKRVSVQEIYKTMIDSSEYQMSSLGEGITIEQAKAVHRLIYGGGE